MFLILFDNFLLLFTLSLILISIYFSLVRKDKRIQKLIDKFPGPPTIPLFGNGLTFAVKSEKLLGVGGWMVKTHGNIWRAWIFNQPYITISTAKYAEKLLSSNIEINKATGEKWYRRRKLLTPSFHFKILEDFIEVFNEQTEVLVNVLNIQISKSPKFDIFPFITRCTLDIICESAMGKKINVQNDPDSEYLKAVYGVCDSLIHRLIYPWLRWDFIYKFSPQGRVEKKCLKVLHGFTEKVIQERKEERKRSQHEKNVEFEETRKKRLAFMDLLLDVSEDGKVLSDLDIREETDTFMFEGHDTTAANLVWTIFNLGSNLECQRKVQEELDSIFGSDTSRPVTMADLSQMKYLECCVKESLRLYPSVPFFARTLNQDLDFGEGLIAPSGTVATIFTFQLHRDNSVFPDPESFSPERFFPENSKGRNPYAFVPFSAGPRNCIGQKFAMMEDKIVLAGILRNFNIIAVDRKDDIQLLPDIILRPKHGIRVILTRRNQ